MPAGFNNGSVMFADNVSFDGTDTPGKVTLDGQLLIGSTVAPNIRVSTLTAGTGVSITNGPGTITIGLAGAAGIETINGDSGSITGSTVTIFANNAANVAGSTVKFVNSGTTSTLNVTDANENTFIGLSAGKAALTGIDNTALGYLALNAITSAQYNVAIGSNASKLIQSGQGNVSIGWNALGANVSAGWNTCIGMQAGQSITGQANIAVGYQAMFTGGTTTNSVCLGYQTGYAMSSGSANVAIGILTLNSLTSGSSNTVLGNQAGQAYTTSESNNILIGNSVAGTVGESNVTRIGNGQTTCYVQGIAGVATSNSEIVTVNTSTGQLGSVVLPFQTVQRTLTSSEIKNLNATPIALIPAQGAGKVIVLESAIAKFTYGGTNVFVAGAAQDVRIFYGTANSAYNNNVISNMQIVGTASVYTMYPVASTSLNALATSALENVAITAYNPVATEISGNAANDNTITIVLKYYVVTI